LVKKRWCFDGESQCWFGEQIVVQSFQGDIDSKSLCLNNHELDIEQKTWVCKLETLSFIKRLRLNLQTPKVKAHFSFYVLAFLFFSSFVHYVTNDRQWVVCILWGQHIVFLFFLWYLLLYLIMKKFKFRLIFLVFYVEAQVDPKMGVSQSIIMHTRDLKELINSSQIVKKKKTRSQRCATFLRKKEAHLPWTKYVVNGKGRHVHLVHYANDLETKGKEKFLISKFN